LRNPGNLYLVSRCIDKGEAKGWINGTLFLDTQPVFSKMADDANRSRVALHRCELLTSATYHVLTETLSAYLRIIPCGRGSYNETSGHMSEA
jgi:hypothetical protein